MIWVRTGLENGLHEMVKDIACSLRLQSQTVMAYFDDYQGPLLTERLFFIKPISKSSEKENSYIHDHNCI